MIRVRGLVHEYPGGVRALDGLTLTIEPGEFVALIGPSGAGKSTLLRCFNGLIPATAGEVVIDGQPVTGAASHDLRRIRAGIGFVFQQFNLLRRLTVLDNVLIGRLAHVAPWQAWLGGFPDGHVRRARAVLQRVGLEGLAERRADSLSGGQQQRVAIARALVQAPRIILADEPMASLDPALSQTVMELLSRINREDGTTVVTSLHVLDLARTYGHRIIGLREGRIVHDGSPASFTGDVAERVFGGAA